ncbi:hypothetical protein KO481_15420 [Nocardia sp. NEAU-G5]|uniref:Uncharacterized protein n=1 Tax=Nocardia albiluteola TaxID=2842303 RepID=A0ABS6B0Z3_9NOCA|nr:hypothetical protein [Nocardia albiluteola]MBU3062909.1 hypothetical protein [Nocardia albiluteola]
MTRDLPSDADAGDTGTHAGDTAYRLASGVARIARAGAYVTGGALIASGGATPTTPHSEDESQIAGWSVKDPQPNAPRPVVTYPDPSPDSVPPAHGNHAPGALAPQDGPPGLSFHFQIGPNGDDHVPGMPDLNKIPGMNGIPGTDGGAQGPSLVPNIESAPGAPQGGHLPGADVPGLGNGIPGLNGGIPGLGNGIPGLGNGTPGGSTPGFHIPGFNSGANNLGLPGMHPAAAAIAADGSPGTGFSPEAAVGSTIGPIDLGDNTFGDGSDFGQFGPDNAAPHAIPDGSLPGFHLPGDYGFEGAGFGPGTGFDGVGSGFGAFFDASTDLDAHVGADGVWLSVETTVHVGVGDIGEELDNYGNYGGWPDAQHLPGGALGPESAFVPGVNSGLLGAQLGMGDAGPANIAGVAPTAGPALPAAFTGAPGAAPGIPSTAFGTAAGAPAAAPVSGVVLPGTSPTSVPGIAGVPGVAMAAPTPIPTALPAGPAPVLGAALPAVSPPPVLAAVPAVAMPQPVVATPALAAVTAPAVAVAQPVVTTPLQPGHSDAAVHPLAVALPEHGPAFGLGIGAVAVSPATFFGIPRPATPPGSSHGEHPAPTPTPVDRPEPSLPTIPRISIAPVPVSGTETPSHTIDPTHTPRDESGLPTTGAHVGTDGSTAVDPTTAAHPGTHGSTSADVPTTPAHPTATDGPTTRPHPGSTNSDGSTTHPHPTTGGSDATTPTHPTPTVADTPTTHAHPGSTGTDNSTTAPRAADSTVPMPGHDTPSSHDSAPSHLPAPTYDAPPTREPVPTHAAAPTYDSPHTPSVPTHDTPPTVSVPGEDGGAHLAPHAPLVLPTLEPGLPMKPIAHVMNSNESTPWDDGSHAGLSAVPASLLSGGLLPGTELYPSHLPVHGFPDLHSVL